MSIKIKYITSDKLNLDKILFKNFKCDDMSITKSSDKTYSEDCKIDKDNPCFGYIQVNYLKSRKDIAKRPLNMALNNNKLKKTLKIKIPSINYQIRDMKIDYMKLKI